jgi:DNA-binding protein Fis
MKLLESNNASNRKSETGTERSLQMLRDMAMALDSAMEAIGTGLPDIASGIDFYAEVRRYEITLIQRALKHTRGNQAQAARLLKLNQTTLHGKIKQYDIYPTGLIYNNLESGEAEITSAEVRQG